MSTARTIPSSDLKDLPAAPKKNGSAKKTDLGSQRSAEMAAWTLSASGPPFLFSIANLPAGFDILTRPTTNWRKRLRGVRVTEVGTILQSIVEQYHPCARPTAGRWETATHSTPE